MTIYTDAVVAQLTGPTVRMAHLARFDFRSVPMRLWTGTGPLVVAAGGGQAETWTGLAELASFSGVAQSGSGLAAEEVEFSISAADPALLARFAADEAETDGRTVTLYEAFLAEDLQPLVVSQVFEGTMGPPTARIEAATGDEPRRRAVMVRAVNVFADRRRPAISYFSDVDQRARSADDAILSRVGIYAGGGKKTIWPFW